MVYEKRWNPGTQTFTGSFIPHESVVSIEWRHIGCLKHQGRFRSRKTDLGICEGDGNLPRESIRICSIQPTEEHAILYDYLPGDYQPRANAEENRHLDNFVTRDSNGYKDSKVGFGSRVFARDSEKMELLVPRGQATDVQVMTRRTSNYNPILNLNSNWRNADIWEAKVENLNQDIHAILNPSRQICFTGMWETEGDEDQTIVRNLDLSAIGPQSSAGSTLMSIEKNTRLLMPRGGVQPYDTICGIHVPSEPWENLVFTGGRGATRELIPESDPEFDSRLDLPTHVSAVNLRWWRKVPVSDAPITTTQPTTTIGHTTAPTQSIIPQRHGPATLHGTGRRRVH